MRALRVQGGSWRLVQAGRFSWKRHVGRVWGMIRSWLDEVGERLTSRQVWGLRGDRGAADRGHCQEHNQAPGPLDSKPTASKSDTKQKKSQLAERRACTCSAGSSDSHLFLGKKTSAATTQGPWVSALSLWLCRAQGSSARGCEIRRGDRGESDIPHRLTWGSHSP